MKAWSCTSLSIHEGIGNVCMKFFFDIKINLPVCTMLLSLFLIIFVFEAGPFYRRRIFWAWILEFMNLMIMLINFAQKSLSRMLCLVFQKDLNHLTQYCNIWTIAYCLPSFSTNRAYRKISQKFSSVFYGYYVSYICFLFRGWSRWYEGGGGRERKICLLNIHFNL